MDKIAGLIEGLKAREKSIKAELRRSKDKDQLKADIQGASECLNQIIMQNDTLFDGSNIDSMLISKIVFICHDIIGSAGQMVPNETLLFINTFSTLLSK